jgi:hypothetical protein
MTMPSNYLEELIIEWYEYQGYFVRNNILVGKRKKGGYETELDIVAFHPEKKHLVHIEPSMDADSWEKREARYSKKFKLGRMYIPELFKGFNIPNEIEQYAVFVFASKSNHKTIGGGKILLLNEIFKDIIVEIKGKRIQSNAISEHMPLIRTLQFVCEYGKDIKDYL